MIANHDDLLTEILLWLPAKSLIRFKLVCKRWLSLISSHRFSHLHSLHHHHSSNSEPTLLLHLADSSDYFYLQDKKLVPYFFSPTLIDPTINSFSNGLFLLQCRNVENSPENCYVYNPTTKQSKTVLLNDNYRFKGVVGLNLAFDPLKSLYYKIICIRATIRKLSSRNSGWRFCQIEVYESETSTWTLCGVPFWAPPNVHFNHGIYWNDAIHWNGVFFDLHNSVVGKHPEVVIPGHNLRDMSDGKYRVSNGYLHYISQFPEPISIAVSELQRNYSEWSLKYHINLDEASWPLYVLSIIRRESEEDSTLVVHQPGKIMSCNFQDKSFKELIDFREEAFYQEGCIQFASGDTLQFIETLAPP